MVTIPKGKPAEKLARLLLQQKLVACVNSIRSVQSLYWWQGKIESSNETLLILKTQISRFKKLSDFIQKNHPYRLPEILALPIQKGSASYLNWIEKSLR